MIISQTPLRISFVGGGSDIASFYQQEAGAVVATAINKYIYIAVSNQFDGRILVNYSKTEIVTKIADIENNLVREALQLTGVTGGIHITSIADVPSEGTGMGSSSAYLVGLLHALYTYQGKKVSPEQLAKEACHIEIDILQKPIGKQDQYIAAYGGFNHIGFNADESVVLSPIGCSKETIHTLEKRLLLFYTGITRSADPILAKQTKNMSSEEKRLLMKKMVGLATDMRSALAQNQLDSFGTMLHENWIMKKEMADGITSSQIDMWYETALRCGALGGKLLGAGGGGFLLFYAPEESHKRIIDALPDLVHQEFTFEPQGSKIVFTN